MPYAITIPAAIHAMLCYIRYDFDIELHNRFRHYFHTHTDIFFAAMFSPYCSLADTLPPTSLSYAYICRCQITLTRAAAAAIAACYFVLPLPYIALRHVSPADATSLRYVYDDAYAAMLSRFMLRYIAAYADMLTLLAYETRYSERAIEDAIEAC